MPQLSLQQAEEKARSALAGSPVFDLRGLCVEQTDEGLLIRGRVCSFYHKQLAQEVVRAVSDRFSVVNHLKVTEDASPPAAG